MPRRRAADAGNTGGKAPPFGGVTYFCRLPGFENGRAPQFLSADGFLVPSGGAHEEVRQELVRLRKAVLDLSDKVAPRTRVNPHAVAVGKREAARRLGVDRTTTLEDLIRSGAVKTVRWRGGVRIPVAELERLAAQGLPPSKVSARRRMVKAPHGGATEVMAIDLDDL